MIPESLQPSLDYLRSVADQHDVPGKITVATARVEINGLVLWVGYVIGFPEEFCDWGQDQELLMVKLTQRATDYVEGRSNAHPPRTHVQPLEAGGFIASYFQYVYRQN